MHSDRVSSKQTGVLSSWGKPYVLGVDGCPDGWIAIALPAHGPIDQVESIFYPSFGQLVNANRAASIMIDMPIGLMSNGRRPCEIMARKILGPRSSSVFPAPRRPMITMESYDQANQWGKAQGKEMGGGLSKQAWMITPKIREIDNMMTPQLQKTICEAHPELAFTRLNKMTPCNFNKRTSSGEEERLILLKEAGLPQAGALFDNGFALNWYYKESIPRIRVARDDVIDAAVCALTARAKLNSGPDLIHLSDGIIDEKGLKIEIWG